ncbi:type I-B CRISPR-associated protein Cas5b [Athalassotoga sp.]|uniref:type I-B CRISPR-associated protein Cas5b n=1 Tax=Athalassotoga sp. TaxID=2022597 RepID=UPI003D0741C7
MKVLRLKIFQETACYKHPFALKVAQTYPLPPYSTVKGMIHDLLKANEYIPLSISIQGKYESLISNLQDMFFYKGEEWTIRPTTIHLLYNVNLIIHINGSEDILERLKDIFTNPSEYPSLGRKEDLVRIDEVKMVNVVEFNTDDSDDNWMVKMPIYIPSQINLKNLSGINYKLNFKYEIKNNLRSWKSVDVFYVEEGHEIGGKITKDEDDNLVCFACVDDF